MDKTKKAHMHGNTLASLTKVVFEPALYTRNIIA